MRMIIIVMVLFICNFLIILYFVFLDLRIFFS